MLLIPPKALCNAKLQPEVIRQDRKNAKKYESCSLGKNALYIGGQFFNNVYYIPIGKVERVYKRLAVSKGFFEVDKTYITISYLVVVHSGGKEKVCRFTREENLDLLLEDIKSKTKIPVGKLKNKK